MRKHRVISKLAIAALGLVGAIGTLRIDVHQAAMGGPSEAFAVQTGTEPAPPHTRDSRAGSDSVSGNVGLGHFLRGSLDMICLSNRHLEGGPFATPEVYRSRGHHSVEKLTWSSPSVTTWNRGRPASTIETSSR